MPIVMDAGALQAFLHSDFPEVAGDFTVLSVEDDALCLKLIPRSQHLRPGGTVSGPSLFALADVAVYLALLSRIGPVPLAVTTNASIDFMRKPAAGVAVLATARLLKLGRTLAVGDVLLRPEAGGQILARASMTYAIPPGAGREQIIGVL